MVLRVESGGSITLGVSGLCQGEAIFESAKVIDRTGSTGSTFIDCFVSNSECLFMFFYK